MAKKKESKVIETPKLDTYITTAEYCIRNKLANIANNSQYDALGGVETFKEYYNSVVELIVTYNQAIFFQNLLTPNKAKEVWESLRKEPINYKVNFLITMTAELRIIFGSEWSNVKELLADAFDLFKQSQIMDGIILTDMYTRYKDTSNKLTLLEQEPWLITLIFIYLMDPL